MEVVEAEAPELQRVRLAQVALAVAETALQIQPRQWQPLLISVAVVAAVDTADQMFQEATADPEL
jgi:hypothetical protein